MKKNNIILLILLLLFAASQNVSANEPVTEKINPHDSLLFDGDNMTSYSIAALSSDCYIIVKNVGGTVMGRVIKREITKGCTKEFETTYVVVEKKLEVGDIMEEGSEVQSGIDGHARFGVFLSGDGGDGIQKLASMHIRINTSSEMDLPRIKDLCERMSQKTDIPAPEKVTVIKGEISYESEPGTKTKIRTVGKRSSVIHTKTKYTHEVLYSEGDTVDVIRVYDGSVEVTATSIEFSDEVTKAQDMLKIAQDFQSGKITAEEFQAKTNEYTAGLKDQSEFGKPVMVDAGSKCSVTRKGTTVEPLGSGDSPWQEK